MCGSAAWRAAAVCVVVLPVACSGRARTTDDREVDGGGHAANFATGGDGTNASGTSGGGAPNTVEPPASGTAGALGAGAGGDSSAGDGPSTAGSRAGGAGERGDARGGHSGNDGDSDAGASAVGEGGAHGCEGTCGCEAWMADCDGLPGCETPLNGPEHCGACGRAATVYEHARMVCTSPDGALPICEPGFADCDLGGLDCETSFEDDQPACLPVYLGSALLDEKTRVDAISVGANGEIYLAGRFSGAVDFDPGESSDIVTGNGFLSGFVTKLAPDGSYLWTRAFSGTNDAMVWGVDIAVARDGSLLFLGTFEDNVDLDPGVAYDVHFGTTAAFVVALSEHGEYRFGWSFGPADALVWGAGVSTNENGEGYVLMGTRASENGQQTDRGFLLTKLDAAGQPLWSRASRGSECSGYPGKVVATGEGVVATGGMTGACELDGFSAELSSGNPERSAGLFARFDANGGGTAFGFFESEDRESAANAYLVGRTGNGGLLVGGTSSGRIDIDPSPAVASRGFASDVEAASFIVRLDEPGVFVRGQMVPKFELMDMAVAEDGSVFLTGFPGTEFVTGPEILAFSPNSRSRFSLGFDTGTDIGPIAASAERLVVAGKASVGADIDPTSGVDVVSATERTFVARFALSTE